MAVSKYVPSEEFPTYEDYRRAKQREHRAAWKRRNAETYKESEKARIKVRRQDPEYVAKQAEKAKAAYAANPEPAKRRAAQARATKAAEIAEYLKSYYEANKSELAAYKKAWISSNKPSVYRRNAARRALCAKATPAWADKQAINDVYEEARYMQMHVDHIVPLNHPLVCGLHVWDNLQLLTKEANLRKNNKFDLEAQHAS